jgi:aminoglycoside phosphotransferase (APT) family kinase protein
VRAAFPSVAAESLQPLGAGWDFDTFKTTDGWVFRFPRRAATEQLLQRERPILDLVRSVLPESVSVPRVRVLDHRVSAFPYRVAAHRFIAGIPADEVNAPLRPMLARTVAGALGALHAVPEATARTAGLVELDRDERGRIEWFDGGFAAAMELRGRDAALDRALEWAGQVDDPLRRLDAPLRMIHHDLSAEHLIADPATGRLVGMLDWTDAILGDPARDFMPLVTFGGWDLCNEVLKHYPHAVDATFRDRLRFMARLLPLMWLGHAHRRGEDTRRHLAWVRNALAEPAAPQEAHGSDRPTA